MLGGDEYVRAASGVVAVVVNYGTSADCAALVRRLRRIVSVVLVDNFSTETERDAILRLEDDVVTVICAPNNGFAGGVNVALRRIRQESSVLLLNPDLDLSEFDLEGFLNFAEEMRVDVACPLVLTRPGRKIWFDGGSISRSGRVTHWNFGHVASAEPKVRQTDFVSGAAMLVSPRARAMFPAMDEEYFMYYEDVDYSSRALNRGLSLAVLRSFVVYHDEGGSSSVDGSPSALYHYFQARNRLLFSWKAGCSPCAAIGVLWNLPRQLAYILRHGQSELRWEKVRAAVQGTVDGLRGVRGPGFWRGRQPIVG